MPIKLTVELKGKKKFKHTVSNITFPLQLQKAEKLQISKICQLTENYYKCAYIYVLIK